jgi:hypothetical protein
VLLHEARNDRDAPALARFMLWLGIGATIGANIAYGAGYGLLGALISAWPAVAFIGSVEIAMQQVRRALAPRAGALAPAVPEELGDVEQAVRTAYAASIAAGQPLSQRAMAERFGLSRRKVSQLVTQLTASGNGHRPGDEVRKKTDVVISVHRREAATRRRKCSPWPQGSWFLAIADRKALLDWPAALMMRLPISASSGDMSSGSGDRGSHHRKSSTSSSTISCGMVGITSR